MSLNWRIPVETQATEWADRRIWGRPQVHRIKQLAVGTPGLQEVMNHTIPAGKIWRILGIDMYEDKTLSCYYYMQLDMEGPGQGAFIVGAGQMTNNDPLMTGQIACTATWTGMLYATGNVGTGISGATTGDFVESVVIYQEADWRGP